MDGYVGSWSFVAEYCIYVFIAVIGMMQIIAAKWELRGITFFRNKKWGYTFGTLAIVAVFIWFFGFTGLNLKEPTFDTPPQLLWLAVSVVLALLVTFGLSSIVNRRLTPGAEPDKTHADGIEMLKQKTYWQSISRFFIKGGSR
jgi:magnesium-transporting ATPase (P-type)